MPRIWNLLNPSRYFFTSSDLEDHLLQIDQNLHELDAHHAGHPQQAQHLLEKSYALALYCLDSIGNSQLDRQLAFLFGEILSRYGQLCFQESSSLSKQILLASLNCLLFSFGLIGACINLSDYHSLEDLKKKCTQEKNLFTSNEKTIAEISLEGCVHQAYASTFACSYPDRRLLVLAQTVRWIGHTYQYMDSKKRVAPAGEAAAAHLFSIAEALLKLVDSEESRRELADLYYQAWPCLRCPSEYRQAGQDYLYLMHLKV
jgi:hypothetical protein